MGALTFHSQERMRCAGSSRQLWAWQLWRRYRYMRRRSRKAHLYERSHETPAENVRKSQWYDHLLSTNPSFRTYRIRKECNPIVNDPELRRECIGSFDVYEPVRPGHRRGH